MPKFIRICPKCNTKDVERDLSSQAYGQGSFFNQFKCNKCGYIGQFFPEITETEFKKLHEKAKKK